MMRLFTWESITLDNERQTNKPTNKPKFVWKLVERNKKGVKEVKGIFDLLMELEQRIKFEDYVYFSDSLFCQEELSEQNVKFLERTIEKYIKESFIVAKREAKKVKETSKNEILKLAIYVFNNTVNKESGKD